MIRRIIQIDKEKCNGCGLCVKACHEGAIGLRNGKAELLRDDYCDGLGDCLPACPMDAISFVEREAKAYDEAAVKKAQAAKKAPCTACQSHTVSGESQLRHFPVQLKLVAPNAPFFQDADLLIAADCTAFACGDFHDTYLKGRSLVIGCPKLDGVDYAGKLAQILQNNEIRSVKLLRMQVPCCGGLSFALKRAMEESGKKIPAEIITVSPQGQVVAREML